MDSKRTPKAKANAKAKRQATKAKRTTSATYNNDKALRLLARELHATVIS